MLNSTVVTSTVIGKTNIGQLDKDGGVIGM